jgi:hypothetical protein
VDLSKEDVNEWVLGLPRTLWEFGEKDTRGSEVRHDLAPEDIWPNDASTRLVDCVAGATEDEPKEVV